MNKLEATDIFLSGILILLLFNVAYILIIPSALWNITTGAITGFLLTLVAIATVSGISILGSGLNSASIKILFGFGSIISILYSVEIAGLRLGMGLATNVLASFSSSGGGLETFGFLFVSILSLMILISGLIMIQGSGE